MVEFSMYAPIENHFLAKMPDATDAIITDVKKVVETLNSLCVEMDQRYELLKDAGVRQIIEYNEKFINRRLNPEKGHHFLPYIVVVIDEFADLIMQVGKEVETPIARIAQKARAVGIHMILATQRPSANVITGVIRANFPARFAFRVSSSLESRVILDSNGAEQLIGRGDMLIGTGSDLTRVQCAFVDTPEVEKITEFISKQQSYPTAFLLPEVESEEEGNDLSKVDLAKRDVLFAEAAQIVVSMQQGSTSFLQRKFEIGFNRAGKIMDQLEVAGIVGPSRGAKPREVLITDMVHLDSILNSL
jgi:S-DNA-T family DNA segregation ATPase FtsK/SpoIIIE